MAVKAKNSGTAGATQAKASPAPAQNAKAPTKGKTAAPVADDDFLDEMDGEGTESIGAGDTANNYLKIAQSNSPEITDGSIEDLKVGMFFDPLSKTVFGKTVELVVLRYELGWNVWAPRERGGGLINRCAVGSIPVVIGDKGKMYDHEGNTVAETQNYHVLVVGYEHLGIFIFSCASTMLKYGRKWNTKIQQLRTPNGLRKAPIYQGVWQIESVLDSNSQGKWFNIGTKSMDAITKVRNITRTEYEEFIQDAYEVCTHIPRIALAGPQSAGALEDHTLDGV